MENKLYEYINSNLSINCDCETRTYIVSIFTDIKPQDNLSQYSLTLLYNEALKYSKFNTFRKIGDWIFFVKVLFPASLSGASINYYDALAQNCYDRCYYLLNKEWFLYETLAKQFPELTQQARQSFCDTSNDTLFLDCFS